MRKAIYRIFATTAVVFLFVSALYAIRKDTHFEVSSTIPTDRARGVPLDQVLTVTFDQELDCSTVTTSTFTLKEDWVGGGAEGWLPPRNPAVPGLVGCVGTTATFTPSSDLAPNTTYTATITDSVKDANGQRLESCLIWCFRTGSTLAPPMVTSVTPLNNATLVPLNTKVTATFDEAMNAATVIASFTLTGPGTTPIPGLITYDAINNIVTFIPSSNLAPLTKFTATISTEATNSSGIEMLSAFQWTFTTGGSTDLTPPTVIVTSPLNLAIDVPLNAIITATFNEPMLASTITSPATTFTLQEHVGETLVLESGTISGTVTYTGTTATFTPTANLAASTEYTATITTGVTNLGGIHMVSNYVWTFTTGTAPDIIPPTVVSTNPVNGATLACINAAITATFSKQMDLATINTGTFTVTDTTSSEPVIGTVSLDITGLIATFTPLVNLTAGDTYQAEITTGVTDLAGIALASPEIWSFTTTSVGCKAAVPLATAGLFGAFGGYAGITNQGLLTVINGSISTTAVSTKVTGFQDTSGNIYTVTPLNNGMVNGAIDTCAPPPGGTATEGNATTCAIATQALADATTAYNALKGLATTGPDPSTAGNLGGKTVGPGVYKAASGAFSITGSPLYLSGTATDVWVFQMASSLTVGVPGVPSNISVILEGGALPKNVFWQVGSAATINYGGGGTMVGTIIAYSAVTLSNPGNSTTPTASTVLDGRAISLTGSVTMVQTVINVPAP
ncbi:MAG: Ig-like domain-containing protein [Terriglobia bacterium]